MKHILFILSFTVFSIGSAQTSGVLSGKILDAELYNEPLLMASLTLKNTSWKAQTNFNGNFEITAVAPGKYTLLQLYAFLKKQTFLLHNIILTLLMNYSFIFAFIYF